MEPLPRDFEGESRALNIESCWPLALLLKAVLRRRALREIRATLQLGGKRIYTQHKLQAALNCCNNKYVTRISISARKEPEKYEWVFNVRFQIRV